MSDWGGFLQAEQRAADAQPTLPADNAEKRAIAYVKTTPEAISGQGGHQATWNAARKLTADFGLDEESTFQILRAHYNPRCQPPWSDFELRHKARDAATKARVRNPVSDRHWDVPSSHYTNSASGDADAPPGDDGFDEWEPTDDDEPSHEEPNQMAWPVLNVPAIFDKLEPIAYLVPPLDLCPGAPALFAGYGYSRKTIAAQSMELAVAAGLPVWGSFAARQGRALHVDYEQGSRLTRERFQRLALGIGIGPTDLEDRLAFVSMPQTYLDSNVESFLAQRFDGFDLVVIDSFRAACPSLEENDSSARLVLDMLTRVSERVGCIVVVIHHARKPSRDRVGGARMAIRGSGALYDACGSVLVFEAEKDQPTRVSHEKARVSGQLVDDFELMTNDVEFGGNPRAGVVVSARTAASREDAAEDARAARQLAKTERIAGKLRELFAQEPDQGGADSIASKVGHNAGAVRAALRILVDAGQVEQLGSTRDRRHRWRG